ncbi:hypothetical protein M9Y10_045664 [Tritrichomonas musculus]|uniref:NTF2 domain-containing protein n=1 Tax=Tritrichomonas musculus TaxID=1915356 RepID=A0ABR2JVU8_9EUKA
MNGSNCYFIDITNNFIQHYFELLSTDTKTLEKMYAQNCKLINGTQKFEGKEAVYKEILTLQGFSLGNDAKFIGQPYGNQNGIIINTSAKINSRPVSVTFVLSEINQLTHQFGITFQLIHPC